MPGKERIDDLAFRLVVIMLLLGKVRIFNCVPPIEKFEDPTDVGELNIGRMLRPIRTARYEQEWSRRRERGNFSIISVVRLTFMNR